MYLFRPHKTLPTINNVNINFPATNTFEYVQLKNVNEKSRATEKAKQFRFIASAPRIMKMKFLCLKEVQHRILWILLQINNRQACDVIY